MEGESGSPSPREQLPPNETPPSRGEEGEDDGKKNMETGIDGSDRINNSCNNNYSISSGNMMDQAVAVDIPKDDTYQCQQVAESQEGIGNLVKLNLGQCSSTRSAKVHIHSGDQSKTDVNCKLIEGV